MVAVVVAMNTGSGNSVAFPVAKRVVDFFGIPVADTSAQDAKLISRAGYSFNRKPLGAADTVAGTNVTVGEAKYYLLPSTGKPIAGQKIIIPTGLTTAKGNARLVTLRVPQSAAVMAINQWIYAFTNTARRPAFFVTERGMRYPVRLYTVTDVNPGNEPEPAVDTGP